MSNRRKLRPAPKTSFVNARRAPTRWNGEPVLATQVRVIVADTQDVPQYWARHLAGTVRAAVRVTYGGHSFYLDDEDGSGWHKVTHGGGPGWAHRELVIEREVFG